MLITSFLVWHIMQATPCHMLCPSSSKSKPRLLTLLVRVPLLIQMPQCLIFCRTNHDCDNLERFLNGLAPGRGAGGKAGGGGFQGKRESGKEHPYSCVVLAGARSMQVRGCPVACSMQHAGFCVSRVDREYAGAPCRQTTQRVRT